MMTSEELIIRHAMRVALLDAQQTSAATEAMAGIPLEGQGPRCSAHGALVAAFMTSRGETVPRPRDLMRP
jgi:hypothetical protein